MNSDLVIEAIGLPRDAMVGQRVPKTLLVENGAPTAADKRLINEGVEELRWVAALKPTTIGIAAFEDKTRQVVELAVLSLEFRGGSKVARLFELIHRAIPYHLMLIASDVKGTPIISCADKRWSQNEGGKVVLDGEVVSSDLSEHTPAIQTELLTALGLARSPHATLYELYRSWIDALLAAEASRVTGTYSAPESPERAAARQQALALCTSLEAEMTSIRSAAAKEKQLARQVDLNLKLKSLQTKYAEARQSL